MDCPPVLAVAETRWLTLVADTTIVVTRWNRTRSSAVRTATREILRAKGRVSGIVLNRMDVGMTKRFSFSDSLSYGSAGKGYYTM
jgi:Mrp family chromosome partitioning ATPase